MSASAIEALSITNATAVSNRRNSFVDRLLAIDVGEQPLRVLLVIDKLTLEFTNRLSGLALQLVTLQLALFDQSNAPPSDRLVRDRLFHFKRIFLIMHIIFLLFVLKKLANFNIEYLRFDIKSIKF